MRPLRHDGTAPLGLWDSFPGHGRGLSVFQIHTVENSQFVQSYRAIARPKLHRMVAVHFLTAPGRITHGTQHGHIFSRITVFLIPIAATLNIFTICIGTFIISTHYGHAFRNHERVAFRIVRIRQRIGMIRRSTALISGYLHYGILSLRCTTPGRIQHFLQLHSTGCIIRRRSIGRSVTVEGHIIHSLRIGFYHIFITTLVSTDIYRTIFDTVGKIHISIIEQIDMIRNLFVRIVL